MLRLLWKESQWTLREGIKSLMNHHVEPPWRNSSNKMMIKRKRSWKHKVKPCNDLDGASRWHNRENLELRKEKMNTRTENYFIMNNIRKKRIESPQGNKNKIYCMLILHQIKLMTSNEFGILLIVVERIKRDIAQAWEGIDGTTSGIWKQRMNWYDNKGRELLNEPP